jgi:hypothetical protein
MGFLASPQMPEPVLLIQTERSFDPKILLFGLQRTNWKVSALAWQGFFEANNAGYAD